MFRKTAIAAASAMLIMAKPSHAQVNPAPQGVTKPTELPPVVVTGNPLGSELFGLVSPTSVLEGANLFLQRRSTLGETLNNLPGVSSTYFGPNASRPVIRGLEGDRIRILSNGSSVLDASSLSNDHAVPIDPLVVERVEVVRGPATLFYGGNAVGGVVNVIDNRIPQEPVNGARGRVEGRLGGAAREKAGGAMVEIGNGRLALHADVYTRDTDDLKIKGPNISPRLQAIDPARTVVNGTLPNSASQSKGGALGGALTWDKGYVGLSFSSYDSVYGTVAEPEVTIDMTSQRWDAGGEMRDIGSFISGVKFKFAATDYKHTELDAGVPATDFKSKGREGRLELTHGNLGLLKGAVGVQFNNFDFSALGAEAFVPTTKTDSKALFIFEELPLGKLKLTFGGRHERTEVSSQGGGPTPFGGAGPRFDPAQSRTFSGNSSALGGIYNFTPGLALALNATTTERAPTYYELFANGPHAATGAYELGDTTFAKEKSRSIDAALRMRSGAHSGSVGVFHSRFNNYIGAFNSGNTRGADGELNPPELLVPGQSDNTGEEVLPELAYRAVPARFRGMEAEGKFRLLDRTGTLDLLLKFDYVRADDRSTGLPLPRIAPRRFGVGLDYRWTNLNLRLDATRVSGQDRVSANELPTDGYTMLNAGVSYRVKMAIGGLDVFVRGVNLLNEDARNHVSFLKDIAPLGKRSGQVGVRMQF
ncbi:MAG TPA: TonB-dependent receptor [Burkholderiales bacterium]|nr:TonB-dependent receptor [Burkholderiales bacterium]